MNFIEKLVTDIIFKAVFGLLICHICLTGAMTLSTTALSIMTLSITTFSIKGVFVTLSIINTQPK